MLRECTCKTSVTCNVHGNLPKTKLPFEYCTTTENITPPVIGTANGEAQNAIEIPPKTVIVNSPLVGKSYGPEPRRPGVTVLDPDEWKKQWAVPQTNVPNFGILSNDEYDKLNKELTEARTMNLVYERQIERLEGRLYGQDIDPERKLNSVKQYLVALLDADLQDSGTNAALAIIHNALYDVTFKDYSESREKYRLARLSKKL